MYMYIHSILAVEKMGRFPGFFWIQQRRTEKWKCVTQQTLLRWCTWIEWIFQKMPCWNPESPNWMLGFFVLPDNLGAISLCEILIDLVLVGFILTKLQHLNNPCHDWDHDHLFQDTPTMEGWIRQVACRFGHPEIVKLLLEAPFLSIISVESWDVCFLLNKNPCRCWKTSTKTASTVSDLLFTTRIGEPVIDVHHWFLEVCNLNDLMIRSESCENEYILYI